MGEAIREALISEARHGLRNFASGPGAGMVLRLLDALSRPSTPAGEGWRLVPVEPTDDMLDAADDPFHAGIKVSYERGKRTGKHGYASHDFTRPMWDAMLAAAPPPHEGGE